MGKKIRSGNKNAFDLYGHFVASKKKNVKRLKHKWKTSNKNMFRTVHISLQYERKLLNICSVKMPP